MSFFARPLAEVDLSYGTVILAEGLAELLPESFLAGIARDDHGQVARLARQRLRSRNAWQ